jgi:hypothetical protein
LPLLKKRFFIGSFTTCEENMSATIQEALEIANVAWSTSCMMNCISKRKCKKCHEEWIKNGKQPGEKPPLFPPDYEGDCPVCSGKLSEPGFSLLISYAGF